ncbi:MAG: hypothetical protein ABI426_02140 [Flavobacterium sp.]
MVFSCLSLKFQNNKLSPEDFSKNFDIYYKISNLFLKDFSTVPNRLVVLTNKQMIKDDYLSVKEVSKLTVQSTRNVRRIIKKIENDVTNRMLYQDENYNWYIHRQLLSRFKLQRIRANKYYALSIDPCHNYSKDEIEEILSFVLKQMGDTNIEINYVIEQKTKNGQNHLHCFVKCSNKKKLIQCFRLGFSQVSYHQSAIFDLENWKKYITKDGSQITKLKN